MHRIQTLIHLNTTKYVYAGNPPPIAGNPPLTRGSGIRIFTGETDRCFLFGTRGFNFRTAPLLSRCEIAWNS